jgi:MFS transporter, CP family, cyanate transporter
MLANSEPTDAEASTPPAAVPRPLRAGLILLGLLLVAANLRAAIKTVGAVLRNIEADQHLSSARASVLVSVPLIAFAYARRSLR